MSSNTRKHLHYVRGTRMRIISKQLRSVACKFAVHTLRTIGRARALLAKNAFPIKEGGPNLTPSLSMPEASWHRYSTVAAGSPPRTEGGRCFFGRAAGARRSRRPAPVSSASSVPRSSGPDNPFCPAGLASITSCLRSTSSRNKKVRYSTVTKKKKYC